MFGQPIYGTRAALDCMVVAGNTSGAHEGKPGAPGFVPDRQLLQT